MDDYGRSLHLDDKAYIPAVHFQNNYVPRDHACFTCHTDYTMFGDYRAKWRGLHHVYVEYFGTIPRPADIKLYTPYNNRECLHCHAGARKFEEASSHHKSRTCWRSRRKTNCPVYRPIATTPFTASRT